jgi:hypothetical protein
MLIPPLRASRVIGEPLRSLFFIIGKANLEGEMEALPTPFLRGSGVLYRNEGSKLHPRVEAGALDRGGSGFLRTLA